MLLLIRTQLIFSFHHCRKNGTKYYILRIYFHAAARGTISFFTLKIINTLNENHLTQRGAFDIDTESTHGQPGSCRVRPLNVYHGLGYMLWIRCLGGKRLLAASYALHRNLIGEGSTICRLFSTQQRSNVFSSDAWPAPATNHRLSCQHCSPCA